MSDKKKNQPDATSSSYDLMLPRWRKMEHVLGGTETMRAAGGEYLMQFPHETEDNFNLRLQFATLFNMTELTLESWVGRPFSDPVVLNEGMAEPVREILENDVDLLGNNVDVFCRNWFRSGLSKALSHVLVEFPRVEPKLGSDGEVIPRTLEDDRRDQLRPFWTLIPPESVIFAACKTVNGQEILTEVRILEEVMVLDGFVEVCKTRIRRLLPGRVEIWEEQQMKNSRKKEWMMTEDYPSGIDYIPLVTFYANRSGFMLGKPPLLDLADLNITHWNSDSEQRNVLSVARFPMLAASGAVDLTKLKIGPKKLLQIDDVNGKFYYVEHSGKAIEAGFKDLAELEAKMAQYGAQFLRKRPGGETATARALDSAEASSPLQDVTLRFVDSVNLAIQYTLDWLKLEDTGDNTVSISTEFGPEQFDGADVDALIKAREQRQISRETFVEELKRRGVLGDQFDAEADEEELAEEAAEFVSAAPGQAQPGQQKEEDTE